MSTPCATCVRRSIARSSTVSLTPSGVKLERDARGVAAVEAHQRQRAVGVLHERELVAGMDVAQRRRVVLRVQRALQIGRRKSVLVEDVGERLAGAHGDAMPFGFGIGAEAIGADRRIGFGAGQLRNIDRHRRVRGGRGIMARRVGPPGMTMPTSAVRIAATPPSTHAPRAS